MILGWSYNKQVRSGTRQLDMICQYDDEEEVGKNLIWADNDGPVMMSDPYYSLSSMLIIELSFGLL